jgi:hypothetical protein
MADKQLEKKCRLLSADISGLAVRIRRYSFDPRVPPPRDKTTPDTGAELRARLATAHTQWRALRARFDALPPGYTAADLLNIEYEFEELERTVDLIQSELISEESFTSGRKTVAGLVIAMVLLIVFYFVTHGVRSLDFSTFEPWPEWGPLKYGEVAFWSSFGVLCFLLFLASNYLARRDFDRWYRPWYLTTALRAPFLTVMLMVAILEFTEWYGEDKRLAKFLLEEGNKFYFIAFTSFCLGLTSERTANILGDLAEGVGDFIQQAASRLSEWLSSFFPAKS